VWVCHALRESLDVLFGGVLLTVAVEVALGYAWHGSAIALASGPAVATAIGTAAVLLAVALRRSGTGAYAAASGFDPPATAPASPSLHHARP
jgi:hypothetical protein